MFLLGCYFFAWIRVPWSTMNINAFRAYFQLNNGLTAGDITNGARLFFGDNDDATGIKVMSDVRSKMSDVFVRTYKSTFTISTK